MAMDLNAKAAYIRGLMTGMEFDADSKNGKVIAAMMDLLEEMAATVTEHDDALDQVYDELETLDQDLDDVVSDIYGDDEDDDDEDEEDLIRRIGPREYVVEAAMKLDDLNDRLGLELESEDYDSVGGLIIGLLDHLPEEGEEVADDGIRFVVTKVDKNRIDRVKIILPKEEKEEEPA